MSTPLRSRDNELASLREQFARLRTGVGTAWLIEGGAGLGKSRMLEEVVSSAREAGFAVSHGVAEPADVTVQFAALMEALFGGPTPLLERAALGDLHSSPEQRYWLLQDIQTLLEQAAPRQPVVICLDDLQWADSGTIAAVRSLPGRLASLPVSWVLAFRPAEIDSDLGRAVTTLLRNGAEKTSLQPLDAGAIAAVAADVLGARPDDALLALAEGVHGNPFFLTELLSGLREERLVEVDGERARLVEARLPRRVRDTMRRRLGQMSPAARKVAAVAASMGRRFTVSDLAAVLAAAASTLLDSIAELVDSEIFVESCKSLSFTHDLVREAVRASQPSSAVHALDRQVASALLAAGALPVEVATRLASSAARGDEVAISTLMKASDALGGTDPGQAADLARRALDLTAERHPLRGPLVARIAVLLHAASRSEQATAFADRALHETLPAEQEAEVRLSIANLFSISPEVRAESCRRALALPGLPPSLRARLLAQLLYNLVVAGRPENARDLLDDVTQAVEVSNDPQARFTLELADSYLHYISDHFETALVLADACLRTSVEESEGSRERLARNLRSGMLAVLDRFDEALAAATDGIRSAQQARHGWALNTFEIRRGCFLFELGQLDDAAAALEGRFNPDDAHLVVSGLEAAGVVTLGRVALHTGDQRQRDLATAIAKVMLRSGVPSVQRHAAWLLALQAHAEVEPAQALRWLTALGEQERLSIFPLSPLDPMDNPQLVRIALASSDRELAEAATAVAERRREINPGVPAIRASAGHARGLLTGDPESLSEAVTILQAGQRRLALASALEDLGVAEIRAGRTQQAIAALDRALAIHAACGASWDLARVRRRLRRLGMRRRLVSQRRPTHGWAAMTDSELAVVRLVAEGLTNGQVAERLYISPHTVSGHLRHAFEKLGINSRVALSRIAAEHTG
jgi:DNA-binding CsgD family transcriptional regulator